MRFLLFAAFGAALFWGVNSSLSDMTKHDCEVNEIQLACESLK
tara:strand:- start:1597 stop:1725 length:129 start_codon:yes stop_codon:yes gene_type:complete